MPISPAEGERYVDEIRRIYADAETSLLQTVARRVERGIDDPGWAEAKLSEIRRLRAEVEATVTDLAKQQGNVAEAVQASYTQGADAAVVELQGLGRRISAGFGTTHTAAVEALAKRATDNLAATHLRILREPLDIYRKVVHEASGFTLTGVETRRQAAQRVLNALADKGISGFVDSAGRSWDMATYAEMATRSATGQAAVQGHIDRLTDAGYELFIVSDSPEECGLCHVAGTRVLTANGWAPIEQIHPGDMVLTHMGRFRPVLATKVRRHTGDLITVAHGEHSATVTPEHPFLTSEGWKPAQQLTYRDFSGMLFVGRTDTEGERHEEVAAGDTDLRGVWAGVRGVGVRGQEGQEEVLLPTVPLRLTEGQAGAEGALRTGRRVAEGAVRGHAAEFNRDCPGRRLQPQRDPRSVGGGGCGDAPGHMEGARNDAGTREAGPASGAATGDSPGHSRPQPHHEMASSQFVVTAREETLAGHGRHGAAPERAGLVLEAVAGSQTGQGRLPGLRATPDAREATVRHSPHRAASLVHGQDVAELPRQSGDALPGVPPQGGTAAGDGPAAHYGFEFRPISVSRGVAEAVPVYSLTVADDETYIAEGFVVHNCAPWEGAILARDEAGKAQAIAEGITVKGTIGEAVAAGFMHANCTHSLSAYIHGLTRPMQVTTFDSAAAYAERQKQRYIERGIRQWKRREAVAITPDDKRKATAKVADKRADMAKFIDDTGRLRQRQRESITRAR